MNLHGRSRDWAEDNLVCVQVGARQALHWVCLAGESAQEERLAGYQMVPEDLDCELLEMLGGYM